MARANNFDFVAVGSRGIPPFEEPTTALARLVEEGEAGCAPNSNTEMRTTNRLEVRVVVPSPIPAACAHPLPQSWDVP